MRRKLLLNLCAFILLPHSMAAGPFYLCDNVRGNYECLSYMDTTPVIPGSVTITSR